MKRYTTTAPHQAAVGASAPPLAPPTISAEGPDWLLHCPAGEIHGRFIESVLVSNALVIAHASKRADATRIAADLPRAKIQPWHKATAGGSTTPRYAVVVENVTVTEAASLLPRCIRIVARRQSGADKSRQADAIPKPLAARGAGHASAIRPAPAPPVYCAAAQVRGMDAAVFAFLLETSDLPAATAARETFAAWCEAQSLTGDYRRHWPSWKSAQRPPLTPAQQLLARLSRVNI